MSAIAIGIDLGTTNSVMAIYINKRVEILENSDGGRITSSFIFFADLGETFVGEHAKRIASQKPDCGIYEVKRLVGRKFSDHYLQQNLSYLPFEVVANASNEPLVVFKHGDKMTIKTPQQLCTIILQKLKKDAEARIGAEVSKAVITVPAYFNVKQREVTLAAAQEAGFTVLKLLNEPTAAALFYYFEYKADKKSYSVVFDLGGGTFDVAVLKKSTRDVEIVGVGGDTQLGGHDFDNLIMNHVTELIKKDYDYDLKSDKNSLRRLHNKCEDAKKALSTVQETVITLIGFIKNHPRVDIHVSRKEFEEMCAPLFKRAINIVDNCLKNCEIGKHLIKEVILSGGSTRIPKIQTMISEYFNGKSLNQFLNPDECVAKGAALQAAMLSKNSKQSVTSVSLKDVVPLSLGVETLAGKMNFLIKRNTAIPTSASGKYLNVHDRQTQMSFGIYEGERLDVRKNRFIGDLIISDITAAAPGKCEVTLTMEVDINGILTVKAKEKLNNNVKQLQANYARGDKSDSEIKQILNDLKNCKLEDHRFKQFVKRKKYLIQYCTAVMYNMKKRNLENDFSDIYKLCEKAKEDAKMKNVENEADVMELIDKVKSQCRLFARHHKFDSMPKLK